MKPLFLFLTIAACACLFSCSKDKSPDFGGTPTPISGIWTLDQTAAGAFLGAALAPRYGFGTDNKYEIVSGTVEEPDIRRGTYTFEQTGGTNGGYTLTMTPRNGSPATIHFTKITDKVIYTGTEPNLRRYFYR